VVYSAKHREYQLVAKSTVPCFLTRVIFTMSVFPLWYAPDVPPELGTQCKFGGTLKKISGASCRSLCPQLQNRVGAYDWISILRWSIISLCAAAWLRAIRLCLNPSKSQFMRCATARRLDQLDDSPITLCGVQITPVTSVRNLGVIMDSSLSWFCVALLSL